MTDYIHNDETVSSNMPFTENWALTPLRQSRTSQNRLPAQCRGKRALPPILLQRSGDIISYRGLWLGAVLTHIALVSVSPLDFSGGSDLNLLWTLYYPQPPAGLSLKWLANKGIADEILHRARLSLWKTFNTVKLSMSLWNRAPQIGTWTHMPELEPSLNPDWDLNPWGQDSNPAKTLIRAWTQMAGTRTRPKPMVFQLRSHTWFQDLMKLRFLISHRRKNSVRDKVTGKKWIYLERNTLHRQCGPSQKVRKAPGYGVVSYYRGG